MRIRRMVRSTRKIAGWTSSASLTSSPIRCSLLAQHGQIAVSGSTITSQRGRLLGRAPMLRLGFGREPREFVVGEEGASSLAGAGVTSSARSCRSRASCSARIAAIRSDRAPKISPFKLAIVARKLSFSASRASANSASNAGSRGRFSGRSAMWKSYHEFPRITSKTKHFKQFSSVFSQASEPPETIPKAPRRAWRVASRSRTCSLP